METSFVKPIATLVQGKVVSFLKAPGVTVLPVRPAGNLPQDFAAAEAADHEHEAGAPDPHIWLDPENAVAMLRVIGKELEAADPANAATYGANAAAAEQRIAALETELGAELAPVKQIPFIPYHDAYQYIERRYGLTAVAAVTLSPEQAPGAKRIEALRKLIKDRNVACVFTEPEFEPAIVRTVVEGTPAKIAVLDPEGAQIPGGPDFYFTLMRQVGRDLTGCLSPSAR
jgi:zinc transport system substrate-binding protein